MKKHKILASLLVVCVLLVGCVSMSDTYEFTSVDFILTNPTEALQIRLNESIYIYQGYTYIEDHGTFMGEEKEQSYALVTGITIGSTLSEFVQAYTDNDKYVVWEYCYDDNSTEFFSFSGLDNIDILYNGVAWLDIGFYQDGDSWKILTDDQIASIWFCDEELNEYNEVFIISVAANENLEIETMIVNYFEYAEEFVAYQGWL